MLIMPRIHRRPVERLKTSRSLSVHKTERSRHVEEHEPQPAPERRLVRDRRKKSKPVAVERRRNDRRLAHLRMRPELKRLLDNSEGNSKQREGRFINETV